MLLNGKPVYLASVDELGAGIKVISIVEDPAVETKFLAFEKDKEPLQFKVEDEEKHIIIGVVMRCDLPIFRRSKELGEYYIMYNKETIELMAQKFLKEGYHENVDKEHSFNLIDGIELQQLFISDKDKGINPRGFEGIEDHSLFAVYKVTDETLWEEVKGGNLGFSLAGDFVLEDEEDVEFNEIMSLIDRLKEEMAKTN